MTEPVASEPATQLARAKRLLLAADPRERSEGIWLANDLLRDGAPGSLVLVRLLFSCARHDTDSRNRVDAATLYQTCTGDFSSIVSGLTHLASLYQEVDTLSRLAQEYSSLVWNMIATLEPMLLELLERGNVDQRLAATRVLLEFRSDDERVAAVVKARLAVETHPLVLGGLLRLLSRMPGQAHRALPELHILCKHDDASARVHLCEALSVLGSRSEVVDALVGLMRDSDRDVRFAAVSNLIKIGTFDDEVFTRFASLMDVLHDDVRTLLLRCANRWSKLSPRTTT